MSSVCRYAGCQASGNLPVALVDSTQDPAVYSVFCSRAHAALYVLQQMELHPNEKDRSLMMQNRRTLVPNVQRNLPGGVSGVIVTSPDFATCTLCGDTATVELPSGYYCVECCNKTGVGTIDS